MQGCKEKCPDCFRIKRWRCCLDCTILLNTRLRSGLTICRDACKKVVEKVRDCTEKAMEEV